MKIDKESLRLENENMYLRPLVAEDVTEEYISGLNDPEVNKYLVSVRLQVQTWESVKRFVVINQEDPSCLLFGVFIKNDTNTLVGTVRVSEIDFFHYTASIGICLFAKKVWKKGYALQALTLVKDYLFNIVKMHCLEAGIYAENTNSMRLFEKAGFSEWYIVKHKFRHVNSFKDVIYFVAINTSFDMVLLNVV